MAGNPNQKLARANSGLTTRHKNGVLDWTDMVRCLPERLSIPLHWKQPKRIFVNSLSDLFHPDVPDAFIIEVFAVMAAASHHIFQVLTKRPERMAALLCRFEFRKAMRAKSVTLPSGGITSAPAYVWPLPNVWLGASVENQAAADARIPHLLTTQAAVRFLSCEPLLGPVDLERAIPCGYYCHQEMDFHPDHGPNGRLGSIGWVIVGAESGHGARPMDVAWARHIKDQCVMSGVPLFYKQDAVNGRKIHRPELDGRTWEQFPEVAPSDLVDPDASECRHDRAFAAFRSQLT